MKGGGLESELNVLSFLGFLHFQKRHNGHYEKIMPRAALNKILGWFEVHVSFFLFHDVFNGCTHVYPLARSTIQNWPLT